MNKLSPATFQAVLYDYYQLHGRHDLPWRQQLAPYPVLVSELMLQQTQVSRVIPKYQAFLVRFPTVEILAAASLGEVLTMWAGLGYNRRAKFLWQAAQMIRDDCAGVFPHDIAELIRLPGVGRNTAGAIKAYAFNELALFIETNVRTVYIHHFFGDDEVVHDTQILAVLAETLDTTHPREFYWALMDYGTFLKQSVGNAGRRSQHYVQQTPFQGSLRQIRGSVIRHLTKRPLSQAELQAMISDDRLEVALADLVREQLIQQQGDHYSLA